MRPRGFARVLGLVADSVLQSMIVIAEVMENVIGIFHRWRYSMGQLIHHNMNLTLKAMYKECVVAGLPLMIALCPRGSIISVHPITE